jgi:hypothetical protein
MKIKKITNINLLLPKDFIDLDLKKQPHLYYLAGPIRGAGDWQKEAIKLLAAKDKNCYIVCPCRYTKEHELYQWAENFKKKYSGTAISTTRFSSQTLWERHYLELASYYGAVIFWLPLESKEAPRAKKDGPYSRDTFGEIGRWSLRSEYKLGLKIKNKNSKRVNLVIGADKDFNGLPVIEKNLKAEHGKNYKISPSLEKTISRAVSLAKKIS